MPELGEAAGLVVEIFVRLETDVLVLVVPKVGVRMEAGGIVARGLELRGEKRPLIGHVSGTAVLICISACEKCRKRDRRRIPVGVGASTPETVVCVFVHSWHESRSLSRMVRQKTIHCEKNEI